MSSEVQFMSAAVKNLLKMLCFFSAVGVLSISCGRGPGMSNNGTPSRLAVDRCKIDLNQQLPATCDLYMSQDDRIVWQNSSTTTDMYACAEPTHSPFDAYSWYVPKTADSSKPTQRKSGKILDTYNASGTAQDDFNKSTSPCVYPLPADETTRTSPHIIIHP
jgi:hypothetical protein